MKSAVIFHPLAAREYRIARKWYAARSADANVALRIEVETAIARIVENPESLPKLFNRYRYARVARFPYVIVFEQFSAALIRVVAVSHTSRRFGYWRRRK
ncbi:MAG TPA: type II toxin-antitoxin system RelE/ParE family toxin [Lacipirellulaceae bacterium]|nr:type II toxin-antitoxin system RelE/ParE family toxin [Lacipirellulaceae bacterium]